MSNMQLDTLRRIVQEINASVSLHDSLDIMVNHVAEAMHVDVCSIYLLDERNKRYVLMASKGLKSEAVGQVVNFKRDVYRKAMMELCMRMPQYTAEISSKYE